ncbi:gliding-associated putative ABC transporter substrate-binding component GldG [Chitinispirillum alkaliphilum]|nr:gliding-associated putative ABC transporter substrate-binding component GldG [Chitinispirillum alkaliphilum]
METKKIKNRTELLIFILSVLAILIAVNYIGTRWFSRFDMTENKQYSISDATKNVLRDLDDIVNIRVFFSEDLPAHLNPIVADVKDILSEYSAYGGRNLRITWIDPSESEEYRSEAQALGIQPIPINNPARDRIQLMNVFLGIAVLFENEKEVIPVVINQNLEYDLTQRIMRVVRTSVPKVGVLRTDDGTPPRPTNPNFPPPPNKTEQQFSPLFQVLGENYDVKTIDLSDGSAIDRDIQTLIIPGVANLTEDMLYEVDQYFMEGGNLIVLANGVQVSLERGAEARAMNSPVFDMLEHYGVRVQKNLILDPSCGKIQIPFEIGGREMHRAVPYPYFVKVGNKGFDKFTPAVSSLSDVQLPWVSALQILAGNYSQNEVTATILASSSPYSWTVEGSFDLNPMQQWMQPHEDNLTSYPIAAYLTGNFTSYFNDDVQKELAISDNQDSDDPINQISLLQENQKQAAVSSNINGNLVVVGNSDFISQRSASFANVTFMSNIVDWLTQDNNLISLRSREIRDNTVDSDLLSEEHSFKPNLIRFANIFLMPSLIILIGLVIFLKRREVIPATTKAKPVASKNKEEK